MWMYNVRALFYNGTKYEMHILTHFNWDPLSKQLSVAIPVPATIDFRPLVAAAIKQAVNWVAVPQ